MSEFTEGLHFRPSPSEHEAALRSALQESGLQGVLFPATARWRTFVPFESDPSDLPDGENTGARLSRIVDAPVLEYHYAEDIFWAFMVWSGGELVSIYTCELRRRKLRVDTSSYEPQWIIDMLLPGTAPEALDSVLTPSVLTPKAGREAARRFTELLGMDHVEWTGPATIVSILEEMENSTGVLVLGSPPPPPVLPDPPRIPSPVTSSIPITLAHHSWSAQQALEQLRPFAVAWSPDAVLCGLRASAVNGGASDTRFETGPWVGADGRTSSTGGWSALFHSTDLEQYINVALVVPASEIVVIADAFPHFNIVGALPNDWIDSSAAIAITEPLYASMRADDTPTLLDRTMQLDTRAKGTYWNVCYMCIEREVRRVDFTFDVAVTDGSVRIVGRG